MFINVLPEILLLLDILPEGLLLLLAVLLGVVALASCHAGCCYRCQLR
jgi:hypothetical protein